MTTVLVVDDHPDNRDLLVTLLGYRGYRLVAAADGEEGLACARRERPDLIISDILMPTMDGFEFVRRLRDDPSLRDVTVLFSSAYYLGPQAAQLAKACGVEVILPKPIEPEAFLHAIDRALSGRSPEEPPPVPAAQCFDDEHRRLMTNQLALTADALQASNQRLGELVQVGLRLGAVTDPGALLRHASHAVRKLAGARLGMAMTVADDGRAVTAQAVAGAPDPVARPRIAAGTVWADIIDGGTVVRLDRAVCCQSELAVLDDGPAIDNFLGAPLGTLERTRGGIGVANKIGAAFTAEDESIVQAVGAQAGRALENMTLLRELDDRSRELKRMGEAKTRLLAYASHDLRQPLQALRLFIDLLVAHSPDERTATLAANASTALSGAESLTNALLEFSHFDSGAVAVLPETFPLSRVLEALAVECGPLAERKGLRFRVEATALTARSDPALLHRAIRNLATNAVRYTAAGEIVVRCRRRRGEIAIQVWDSGRGIPADRRETIFEDFFRIEDGGHRDALGLGLAIVARNAKMLGGRVRVHSRLGRGSVFSFIVPAGDATAPAGIEVIPGNRAPPAYARRPA